MKKYLLIILAISFSSIVYSQIPWFSLNPRIGLNYNDMKLDDIKTVELRPGWSIGLSAELGKKNFIEPGVHFISYNSGQKIKDDFQSLNFSAIQFQMYYGRRLLDAKVAKIKIHLGPTYDVITNVGKNNLSVRKSDFEDGKWGLNMGIGAQVLFITLFFDYNLGLTKGHLEATRQGIYSVTVGVSLL